jgi:hypothetical protein
VNSVTQVGAFMDVLFFFWVFPGRAESGALDAGLGNFMFAQANQIKLKPGIAHARTTMAKAAAFLLTNQLIDK